jgi:hypothetical protein
MVGRMAYCWYISEQWNCKVTVDGIKSYSPSASIMRHTWSTWQIEGNTKYVSYVVTHYCLMTYPRCSIPVGDGLQYSNGGLSKALMMYLWCSSHISVGSHYKHWWANCPRSHLFKPHILYRCFLGFLIWLDMLLLYFTLHKYKQFFL